MPDDFLGAFQAGAGVVQRGFENQLQVQQLKSMDALRQVQERAMAQEADFLTQRAASLKFQQMRSQWQSDQTRSIINQKNAVDQQIDAAEQAGQPAPMSREENFIRSTQALSLVNPQAAAILRANAMQAQAGARQTAAEAAQTRADTGQDKLNATPTIMQLPGGQTLATTGGKTITVPQPKVAPVNNQHATLVNSIADWTQAHDGAPPDSETYQTLYNSAYHLPVPKAQDPQKFMEDYVKSRLDRALMVNGIVPPKTADDKMAVLPKDQWKSKADIISSLNQDAAMILKKVKDQAQMDSTGGMISSALGATPAPGQVPTPGTAWGSTNAAPAQSGPSKRFNYNPTTGKFEPK